MRPESLDQAITQDPVAGAQRPNNPSGAMYTRDELRQLASCAGIIGKKTPDGRVLGSDADFVMYLLDSQNLAVVQGEAYGLSPFIRISFATSMETLDEGTRRLRLACEALR